MLFSFSILEIYEAFLNGMCLKFELIKLINKVKNFNMSRCIKARENGCCCLIYMFCAGYVLSCLPFLSDDHQNIHKQLELIQNLKLPPDFVINIKVFLFHLHWYWFFFFPSSFYSNSCFFLKCPDSDLVQRLSGLKKHPETGQSYSRDQWEREEVYGREEENHVKELESEEEQVWIRS